MCGIAGLIGRVEPDEARNAVAAMIAALGHRGPDGEGMWSDEDGGAVLGHRRLAVIDLSPAAAQPMRSGCGRYVVVYNGEIYNAAALRRELEAAGVGFGTRSDTEVLLAAMAHWGVAAALPRLNGMFAFALWDRRERRLTLGRDRMGIKPLYWSLDGGRLMFGSELKALRACPGWQPILDHDAFAAYLTRLYVPAPATIYRGVQTLAPGSLLNWQVGQPPSLVRWWSLADTVAAGQRDRLPSDPDTIDQALQSLLGEVAADHLIADVPVGAFLSGGIDSSVVVALMRDHSRSLHTFSIGYDEADHDESAHARAVAAHFGVTHHELRIDAALAAGTIPDLAGIYDEPFADGSQLPTVLVSRLARRQVTVALSGDGGDELFAGYDRYWEKAALWRRAASVPAWLRPPLAAALDRVPAGMVHGMQSMMPARLRLLADARQSLPVLRRLLRLPVIDRFYADTQRVWPNPPVPAGAVSPLHPCEWPELSAAVADPLDRMQYADAVTVLPDDLLVKVDRASMAAGLEVRVPLLDHRVVQFAFRVAPAGRGRAGVGKAPLRRLLRRRLPRELIERPKMGFAMPMSRWLRGPLRGWAGDLLSSRRLGECGLFDADAVRREWQAFQDDSGRTYDSLWGVLMGLAWLDRWGAGLSVEGP
jgi:asparagine synthase (glutamine-hydrolysing)